MSISGMPMKRTMNIPLTLVGNLNIQTYIFLQNDTHGQLTTGSARTACANTGACAKIGAGQ